ncbi:MAG: NADH-quinone oxidoreductase subunit NuoH [Acidimicrobiia bacterium]|nr:MAG: NADH-quinone oxidoreductase subunit NuoH [Acidimicrobiia bacterium]
MSIFIEASIRVLLAFVFLLVTVLLLVWVERKFVSDLQNRIGPSRAGPFGILQTLADGMKAVFKEGITPARAEFGLYIAAPVIAMITALLTFLVIPIGAPIVINGTSYSLAAMDINVGLLYILAMSSIGVYAVTLAGWASGSKYPLLGSVRASAQMISYEAAMGLALVPVVMFSGSLSVTSIVEVQQGTFGGFIPAWNLVLLPSFVIFLIAGFAETNRAPFDLVEAEQEIVGGFHTEYSGMRFALFFLAEYINVFNISALTAAFFLGGWSGPVFGPTLLQWFLPIFWFLAKTWLIVLFFVWVRASMPRMRYDQLMAFGWKRLIPVSLAWIILVAIAMGFRNFGAPWT